MPSSAVPAGAVEWALIGGAIGGTMGLVTWLFRQAAHRRSVVPGPGRALDSHRRRGLPGPGWDKALPMLPPEHKVLLPRQGPDPVLPALWTALGRLSRDRAGAEEAGPDGEEVEGNNADPGRTEISNCVRGTTSP